MTKLFRFFFIISFITCSLKAHAYPPILEKAIQLSYNAQFKEAESLLEAYTKENPNDPLGFIIYGTTLDWKQKIQSLQGKLNQTILEHYKKANHLAVLQWEKDQDSVEKMVILGNSYMFLSKKWLDLEKKNRAGLILKKCKNHMLKAIELDPERYDAYMAVGIFNFYAAHIPAGLKFLAKIIGISGNEKKGLDFLEKAATHPNLFQADALFVLSHAYGRTKKNYRKAKEYIDLLITKYPQNYYFKFLKAETSHHGKLFAASRQEFNDFFQFCETLPKGVCNQDLYFVAHYFLTDGYLREKNYQKAKVHLQKALELDQKYHADRSAKLANYQKQILENEGKNQ